LTPGARLLPFALRPRCAAETRSGKEAVPRAGRTPGGDREEEGHVFDPKNRIHWVAAIVILAILILILGVTATASGQEPPVRVTRALPDSGP